jgi:hypothetical protein
MNLRRNGILLVWISMIILQSACKDLPNSYDSADLELSRIRETENFIFRYSEGDFVYADRTEAYHRWAVNLLNVQVPKKIDFFKYRDRAQQLRMTGSYATGFADVLNFEIHTAEAWIPHEAAHIYFSLIGTAPALFNEGIAVAMQIDPYNNDYTAREKGGEPVHSAAGRLFLEGRLYPLEDILSSQSFLEKDFTVTYIQGGSFVGFLMDFYGIEMLKTLFRTLNYSDSTETVKSLFLGVYEKSIVEMEAEWLGFLSSPS